MFEHRNIQRPDHFAHIGWREMLIYRVAVLLSHIKIAKYAMVLRCKFLGAVVQDDFPLLSSKN
jgi:hypothetical protein